jgi:hypothetical protein
MVEEKMSGKTLASVLIVLFIVSIVPVHADEGAGVNLTVTIIAPEYETYVGHGLLYIEDQRAYGKAYLFVPQDTAYPVKLDIIKGKKVVASWEWDIISHETNTIERRKYDIIFDTYKCKNGDERSLLVEIISYRGSTQKTSRASAIGIGAFFFGKSTSP